MELAQHQLAPPSSPPNGGIEEEGEGGASGGEGGEEYQDVMNQCESTEADQYKMNPEADQSVAGAVGHLDESDAPLERRVHQWNAREEDEAEENLRCVVGRGFWISYEINIVDKNCFSFVNVASVDSVHTILVL